MLGLAKNTKDSQRILTWDFALLFAINFIVILIEFLFLTTMAVYAMQRFEVDGAIAGLTASIFMVGGVVGRFAGAELSRRLSLRTLCTLSLVGQLVFCLAYFAGGLGVWFLIGVRFAHGVCFGIANTAVPAIAVDSLPKERLGEGTGYFMLSNSLGVGVGPLMSILVAIGMDYLVLFVICAFLAAVALAASFLLFRGSASAVSAVNKAKDLEDGFAKADAHGIRGLLDLSTIKISVFMFLVAFSCSSLNSFVSSYANELGMGVYAPMVFLVYSAALLITRPITGKIMDRYGENAVLYPSIISMAIGLALAACVSNPAMLLACGIFMATGFGTCMSTGQAVVTSRTKSGGSALAISTFFVLCDISVGAGPFFLGFIVESAGYRAMYWQCAFVALLAVVYYHFAHGRWSQRRVRSSQG